MSLRVSASTRHGNDIRQMRLVISKILAHNQLLYSEIVEHLCIYELERASVIVAIAEDVITSRERALTVLLGSATLIDVRKGRKPPSRRHQTGRRRS